MDIFSFLQELLNSYFQPPQVLQVMPLKHSILINFIIHSSLWLYSLWAIFGIYLVWPDSRKIDEHIHGHMLYRVKCCWKVWACRFCTLFWMFTLWKSLNNASVQCTVCGHSGFLNTSMHCWNATTIFSCTTQIFMNHNKCLVLYTWMTMCIFFHCLPFIDFDSRTVSSICVSSLIFCHSVSLGNFSVNGPHAHLLTKTRHHAHLHICFGWLVNV